MKMICKKEALRKDGRKIMEFTKGVIYNFEKINDPEGWKTLDDFGNKEVFFALDLMFNKI